MPLVLERSWLGRRVTLRRVVDRGPDGRPLFGDVVGDLVALAAGTAAVRTRTGEVDVVLAHVVAAKLAPPSTAQELALEAVAARGWRAEQTGEIGGWLLRASRGFTGRANSVLPLRAPGVALDDALAAARAWYAARDLPTLVQVPIEARRLLDAGLAERGWPAGPEVDVLAARLDALRPAAQPDEPPVGIAARPDREWFARYRDGAGLAEAARAVLTRHDRAGFASIRLDGRIVAIARGTLDDGWLGVSAVEVAPELRRQGLASMLMRALWRWAIAAGAERSYVQVSSDNAAAVALYPRLGYWRHHGYHYRRDPDR
jgi:ribosomal protein S18 acetylase RimI-like enzyme